MRTEKEDSRQQESGRPKRIRVARSVAASGIAVGVVLGGFIVGAGPANANPSANCWAYGVGATVASGGCKGTWGGTTFRVGAKCGWLMTTVYSRYVWTPSGRATTVSTSSCPWYSRPIRVVWVESE